MCASAYPDAKIYIFYIDLRAPGQRYEKFYQKIKEDENIFFIKGKVAEVAKIRPPAASPWWPKMRSPGKRSAKRWKWWCWPPECSPSAAFRKTSRGSQVQ